MRRAHRVPLSSQSVGILRRLNEVGGGGDLLFPSIRTPTRAVSDNTMNAALRRLGYAGDEMTAHVFRATAPSLLHESGEWYPDASERPLAHVDSEDDRRHNPRSSEHPVGNEWVSTCNFRFSQYLKNTKNREESKK